MQGHLRSEAESEVRTSREVRSGINRIQDQAGKCESQGREHHACSEGVQAAGAQRGSGVLGTQAALVRTRIPHR